MRDNGLLFFFFSIKGKYLNLSRVARTATLEWELITTCIQSLGRKLEFSCGPYDQASNAIVPGRESHRIGVSRLISWWAFYDKVHRYQPLGIYISEVCTPYGEAGLIQCPAADLGNCREQ